MITTSLHNFLQKRVAQKRPPDFITSNGYVRRWWIIPRNRFFNIYLHHIILSDERPPHDHPWCNLSFLLIGSYIEHRILAGGVHIQKRYVAGNLKLRRAKTAHRLALDNGECWSLFFTGPVIREYGFHYPTGWRHWKDVLRHDNGKDVRPTKED